MKEKTLNRKLYLRFQLTAAIFTLITVLVCGFFIFGPNLTEVARALTGNYNKATGNQLTTTDWNNLDDDFVAKSGSTMTGVLNMGSQKITGLAAPTVDTDAVTKLYADSQLAIFDAASGQKLRMICGKMPLNASNTVKPYNWTLHITVNTAPAGFSNVFYYLSSLGGDGNHYRASGVNTIYLPDNNSYEMWLQYYDPFQPTFDISVTDVMGWNWYVSWCGLGI